MSEKAPVVKKGFSADWLLRGALTKIGDTVDRFTGRRWIPSSSLATSELVERIKKLLDAEAQRVPGKGLVVPHNIKLKMQWDKFSTDAEDALKKLEHELLTATVDHINDSRYYTYAPISLEVTPDYFIEGVKLLVSFDKFADEEREVELNVTVPAIRVADVIPQLRSKSAAENQTYIARFEIKGTQKEKRLEFPPMGRLSVGRTASNDLIIDDASVSKMHASLSVDADGRLSTADTGSTNGTFLNDQRISYGKATRLEAGDHVKFGTVEVIFEYVPRPMEIETDDGDKSKPAETTEIDGFEFKKRVSEDDVSKSLPAIPLPDETLKLDPSKELKIDEGIAVAETAVENSRDNVKAEHEE